MYYVIKNKRNIQKAYRLGSKHPVIEHMIKEAKHGEAATIGDYIKIDGTGYPYPNEKSYFEANHRLIKGDEYEQKPVVLKGIMWHPYGEY